MGRLSLSASHASYWKLLGIEVWIRSHGNVVAGFNKNAHRLRNARIQDANPLNRSEDKTLSQNELTEDTKTDSSVSVSLRGFRSDKVFVVVSEDAWASRKMVIDVARSINLYRTTKRKNFAFKWPQIENADNTFAAMIRAFETFLRSQNAENDVLIASGEVASEIARVQSVSSDIFVISKIPKNGKEKRILWERIRKLL